MKKRPALQIDKTATSASASNRQSSQQAVPMAISNSAAVPLPQFVPRGMNQFGLSTSAPVSVHQYPRIAPNPTSAGVVPTMSNGNGYMFTPSNASKQHFQAYPVGPFGMDLNSSHGMDTQTINPSVLSADAFLADTLFPLQMDTEMRDAMQMSAPVNTSMLNNGVSPYENDSHFADDYLADDIDNSVLSASLPEDGAIFATNALNTTGNSSPVTYQMAESAPVSATLQKPLSVNTNTASATAASLRKNRSQSSTSVISVSPSHDLINASSASLNNGKSGSYQSRLFGNTGKSVTVTSTNASDAGDDDDLQKHVTTLEKQRKRRESHNAVERRRRDNINERIAELGQIVPDAQSDSGKPQKGIILKKTTDYIRHLQRMNSDLVSRVKELEKELDDLKFNR